MSALRFGSVCSGIEAASVAFEPLGWEAAWFSEIEKFPSSVLAHRFPDVPNLGDMTLLPDRIRSGEVEAPDVLCGGTPCQAFSIAGLRNSLSDARGNLTLTFVEIANAIDAIRTERGQPPAIILWENVPGVLNTHDGAFGCFLGALAGEDEALEPAGGRWSNAGCVYGPERAIAWRLLNAEHFGVPQRRKRLLVVACPLERAHPTQILFEFEGERRDSAPSRDPQEVVAGSLKASSGGVDQDSTLIVQPYAVANCMTARMYKGINTTLDEGQTPVLAYRVAGDGAAYASEEITAPLLTGTDPSANLVLAFVKGTNPHSKDECPTFKETETSACLTPWDERHNPPKHLVVEGPAYSTKLHNTKSNQAGKLYEEYTPGLQASSPPPALLTSLQVRRLLPVECERLQGFPTVTEKVSFEVCIDQQSNSVHVAHKSLRSRSSALTADAERSSQPAVTVAGTSYTPPASPGKLVVLSVRQPSGEPTLEIRSQGRLLWSASGAEPVRRCHQPTLNAGTAQELAQHLRGLVSSALSGGVGSPLPKGFSLAAKSGSGSAGKSGAGTRGCVAAADASLTAGRFTTSNLGQGTKASDSTLEILFSSVMAAISGFTPDITLPQSFSVEVSVESGWTDVPGASDTSRYKALGNSWPVPMIRWVGARIAGALR